MAKGNPSITLIGVALAKPGVEFIFNGPATECDACKLRNTCLNLAVGRKYRISATRGTAEHKCALHDVGVRAVEVAESPSVVAIDSKKAFSGSKIVYKRSECDARDCKIYELCHPSGIEHGEKLVIAELIGDVPEACAEGRSLKLVELKR